MSLPEHHLGQLLNIGGLHVRRAAGISLHLSLKSLLTNMFRDRRHVQQPLTA